MKYRTDIVSATIATYRGQLFNMYISHEAASELQRTLQEVTDHDNPSLLPTLSAHIFNKQGEYTGTTILLGIIGIVIQVIPNDD